VQKREELTTLTSLLHLESQSEAAQAAAAAATERMRAAGRQPGWSLHLNPAPALCAEGGYLDADSYRFAHRMAEAARTAEYRDQQREQGLDNPGVGQPTHYTATREEAIRREVLSQLDVEILAAGGFDAVENDPWHDLHDIYDDLGGPKTRAVVRRLPCLAFSGLPVRRPTGP
jgi:hypothetical protein